MLSGWQRGLLIMQSISLKGVTWKNPLCQVTALCNVAPLLKHRHILWPIEKLNIHEGPNKMVTPWGRWLSFGRAVGYIALVRARIPISSCFQLEGFCDSFPPPVDKRFNPKPTTSQSTLAGTYGVCWQALSGNEDHTVRETETQHPAWREECWGMLPGQ